MTVRCPPRNLQKGLAKDRRRIGHSPLLHIDEWWPVCSRFETIAAPSVVCRARRDFNNHHPLSFVILCLLGRCLRGKWGDDLVVSDYFEKFHLRTILVTTYSFSYEPISVENEWDRRNFFDFLQESFQCFSSHLIQEEFSWKQLWFSLDKYYKKDVINRILRNIGTNFLNPSSRIETNFLSKFFLQQC